MTVELSIPPFALAVSSAGGQLVIQGFVFPVARPYTFTESFGVNRDRFVQLDGPSRLWHPRVAYVDNSEGSAGAHIRMTSAHSHEICRHRNDSDRLERDCLGR